MLLACSDEDKKTYPLKWVPDSANPTGLFVPRLNGLFARYCSRQGEAGAYNEPGVPDITGGVHTGGGSNDGFTGAFYGQDISLITGQHPSSAAINSSNFFFAASRASHVYGASDTVMPPSVDLPVALYLGGSTEV